MATRNGSDAAAKTRRDGRKAVAHARSSALSGTRWWIAAIGIVVLVVLLTIARLIGWQRTSQTKGPDINDPAATVAVGGYTTPPWPAPADATDAVNAAGLPMLGREGNVEHIHAHLDVLVDGQAVPVPADIGIDVRSRTISPLHTHDATGVLHIESPVKRQFSLGEFFSEWQVSLSEDNIGGLRTGGGKVVRVFVNGTQRNGNPGAIMLGAHDEVAVLYGRPQPGETIPRSYHFGGGL
ncbi:MAG: hypothetical protein WCC28_21545 [Mycobacterium sp.]|uniref:hypothetical protein n=1 Tax=Mycobacterium sp. TaxID=1785 RepID=UPI003C78280F